MAKKSKKSSSSGTGSKRTLKLNMSKVDKGGGGGRIRIPEDDYKVKIVKVEKGENKNSGNAELRVTHQIISDEQKGKKIKDYMTLTEAALWRVGNLLDAVGMKWSQKVINIPLDKLEGKVLGITVIDDEYKKKISSKIADFLDEETIDGILEGDDEDDDDVDDDDELDEDEDEDEDEDDDDDDDDLDEVDVDDEL
jgi:phosphopantothenoylcysteine synthetase/decarboxylase